MKNKLIVPQPGLPDSGLYQEDISEPRPTLSQAEIVGLMDAYHKFQVARADYEMKRGAVTLKLLLLYKCENSDCGYEIELNQKGGLIISDRTGIPLERMVIGEGDATPALYQ